MIREVVRIGWLTLKRDRVALMLSFALPIAFFTVFALVFGGMDQPESQRIRLLLVIEENTPTTQRLREIIGAQRSAELVQSSEMLSRDAARQQVRDGSVDAAIAVPVGFAEAIGRPGVDPPAIWMCANEAHPLAMAMTEGLIQSSTMTLVLESLAPAPGPGNTKAASHELVKVNMEAALATDGKKPSIAYFAAGIGVMFLLFTVSGRSAILIEERETGVLTRLLTSRLTLTRLLLGRWLFLVGLGCVQVTLMFFWASVAFGLELWTPRHLAGFFITTIFAAGAAAGLGVLLAVSCRSRAQLNGIATVLILLMSALGGSMFPRFLMSEQMKAVGRFTFNAWALDGYQKIFWFDSSPLDLWREMMVLVSVTIMFLCLAIRVARKP